MDFLFLSNKKMNRGGLGGINGRGQGACQGNEVARPTNPASSAKGYSKANSACVPTLGRLVTEHTCLPCGLCCSFQNRRRVKVETEIRKGGREGEVLESSVRKREIRRYP